MRRWTLNNALAWLCYYTGVSLFFSFLNCKRKKIITYHNVIPDHEFNDLLHEGVSHSLSIFRSQINYLTTYFKCDTDLYNSKSITITFDDGYLNQYKYAYPILVEFKIKAYFFVALDLIESGEALLIDRILMWLSYVPFGTYLLALAKRNDTILVISSDCDRMRCWQNLNQLLYLRLAQEEEILFLFENIISFKEIKTKINKEYYQYRFCSALLSEWDKIKKSGYIIGAHSKTHKIMKLLNDNELKVEIASCVKNNLFNTKVFSYPFGGVREVSQSAIDLVKLHGFTMALANCNYPLNGSGLQYSKYFIPRMSLPNTNKKYVLSFILSGAKYFLKYRKLLPQWE